MAKTESTLKNMVLSLTLVALGASVCLGFIYEITKGPIETTALNKKLDAIKQVVPDFNNNPDAEMFRLSTGEAIVSMFIRQKMTVCLSAMQSTPTQTTDSAGILR